MVETFIAALLPPMAVGGRHVNYENQSHGTPTPSFQDEKKSLEGPRPASGQHHDKALRRAPLIRQDHSSPLLPYQTRNASPFRASRSRNRRIELVSFMLTSL
jgi:hypothetical protein